MNKPSFLVLAAALATASCGTIKPSKNPDALAMDVPLEQASSASSNPKTAEQSAQAARLREDPTANIFTPETMKTVTETRDGVSAICAEMNECSSAETKLFFELEAGLPRDLSRSCRDSGDFNRNCTDVVFRNYFRNDPRVDLLRQMTGRCLSLMLQCQKEK